MRGVHCRATTYGDLIVDVKRCIMQFSLAVTTAWLSPRDSYYLLPGPYAGDNYLNEVINGRWSSGPGTGSGRVLGDADGEVEWYS